MQQVFNASSAADAVGRRAGITGTEMAETLESLFAYFKKSLQANPDMLHAIESEASEWRAKIPTLRGASQETIDYFFGHPASKDIIEKLAAEGITPPDLDPGYEYGRKVSAAFNRATVDPQSYLQGKVVPTISEYRQLLKFDASREKLDGDENGPAHTLLQKIDSFQGGFGAKHGAGGGLGGKILDYIANAPRHPAEIFVQQDVRTDYLNAFDHTYSRYLDWKPSADMQSVTAVSQHSYGGPQEKNEILSAEKAKFEAALIERGGINATVEVKLGKTFAEDAIVITMSMEDYTTRYIPIMTGKLKIDLAFRARRTMQASAKLNSLTAMPPARPPSVKLRAAFCCRRNCSAN